MTLGAITRAAFERAQGACTGRDILAVQDTTVTRSSGGGGHYLHAMIAVDAHNGAVLGALDALFLERTSGKSASRDEREPEARESHRWLAATERAAQIAGAERITVVADREADMFDLFARRPENVALIVRAHHDRALATSARTGTRTGTRVAEQIATMPRLGCMELALPALSGRPARLAKLSVRFGKMSIKPPRRMEKFGVASVPLTYVDLREETPPYGVKPIHWRLLTTYDIATGEDALDVARRYAKRWKIEEVFRTMKRKGFDIEGLRIADTAPRNKLILACFIAATVVMQMVGARDGSQNDLGLRPLTDAFDPSDQPILQALNAELEGKTKRQQNPHPKESLAFATWVCARLGGWTGYYGKPGPIVILRGWTEFQSIKHGTILTKAHENNHQILV